MSWRADAPPAISLRDVTVRLGGTTVLEQVTADVPAGSFSALIGPNGAGKTTLLRAVLGQVPFSGEIRLFGRRGRRCRIGYVPQRLDFDRGAPIRAIDLLCADLQRWPVSAGIFPATRRRAEHALALVHAQHLAGRCLGALSGGELQRVMLALATLREPELLLLDEPAAGVDVAGEVLFCDLLEELHRRLGITLLLVSHDLSVVTTHADHVICLNRRVQCQGPPVEVLTPENLQHMYGMEIAHYAHRGPHTQHMHRTAEVGTEPPG